MGASSSAASSSALHAFTLSNMAPRMLYITKRRDDLDYCYVAVSAVVSMYFIGPAAYLELSNQRTLRVDYANQAEAERAVSRFHFAMSVFVSKEDADKEWPKPIDGAIVRMIYS